jgi:hypothetical protein
MELRNHLLRRADPVTYVGGHMKGSVQRELPFDAAELKTLLMHGSSMRENRETPATSAPDGGAGRSGKAKTSAPDMHGAGESDVLVVPTKRANKVT